MPVSIPGCLSPVLLTRRLEIGSSSEPLPWVQRNILLTDYWLIRKGYTLGIARWQRCIGHVTGKGLGASLLSPRAPLSPNLRVSTNLEALGTLFFRVFMEASWLRPGSVSHWPFAVEPNLWPVFPPWIVPIFSHGWFPGSQPWFSGLFQKPLN